MRTICYGDYEYMERVYSNKKAYIARTKQVRKQKMILSFGIFITILFIAIVSIKAFVYANDSKDTTDYGVKQYKSIMIYCGDDVESIAEEYINGPYSSVNSYAYEIMNINHISNETQLIPGNYIVIPYYTNAL